MRRHGKISLPKPISGAGFFPIPNAGSDWVCQRLINGRGSARRFRQGMTTAAILICALLLDALLGEPRWLWSRIPHPAVLMGNLIGWADERFNTGTNRKAQRRAHNVRLGCRLTLLGSFAQLGWIVELIACGYPNRSKIACRTRRRSRNRSTPLDPKWARRSRDDCRARHC